MIKKTIVLVGLLFLLTGCTVDYNLYINKGNIDEQIIFNGTNVNIQPFSVYYDVDGFSETGVKLDGIDYYDESLINNSTTLSYSFTWDNYNRSRAVRTCLKSHKLVINNDNNYMLNTSIGLSCFNQYPNLDKLNINISLDDSLFEVISSNADSNVGSYYTWVINENNYDTKHIQLVFNYKKRNTNPDNPNSNSNNGENNNNNNNNGNGIISPEIEKIANDNFWLIMIGAFVLLVVGIFIVIKVKSSKR